MFCAHINPITLKEQSVKKHLYNVAVMSKKLGHARVICVSTQLIEAGVNISFGCVVRSLAGLDSIAQAAGRCNRHGERECSDVYIVNVEEENVSKLVDIKEGQECTKRVLDEFKENPHIFDNDKSMYDLLSDQF
mgnify:CR=1 FL=1